MFGRITAFVYGMLCYLVLLRNLSLRHWVYRQSVGPQVNRFGTQGSLVEALLIDAGLLMVFGIQHSVMARQWFKRAWTRVIPEPVERSTYVLLSSLLLLLLFWQWRPIGGVVWNVENPAGRVVLYAVFAAGWLLVLSARS